MFVAIEVDSGDYEVKAESDTVLGIDLLWRNRITIDVHANGQVTIEELG